MPARVSDVLKPRRCKKRCAVDAAVRATRTGLHTYAHSLFRRVIMTWACGYADCRNTLNTVIAGGTYEVYEAADVVIADEVKDDTISLVMDFQTPADDVVKILQVVCKDAQAAVAKKGHMWPS